MLAQFKTVKFSYVCARLAIPLFKITKHKQVYLFVRFFRLPVYVSNVKTIGTKTGLVVVDNCYLVTIFHMPFIFKLVVTYTEYLHSQDSVPKTFFCHVFQKKFLGLLKW